MPRPLAVLIVEDTDSDAQLMVRLLRKAGYELVYEQVETEREMRAALERQTWDIVISDFQMPQFDGRAALQLVQDMRRDIPFIVVSGTIGEETAVSMMKAGAHDYLIKGDLGRLVPAVERELEQAEIRRGRREAERALAASESELRALFSSMHDVVMVIDREGTYRKIAPTNPDLLFRPSAEMLGKNLREIFPSERAEAFISVIRQVLDTKQTSRIDYDLNIDNRIVWFETSISPVDEDSTLWVARDVTERKHAEEAVRESEEKYKTLFDSLPESIALIGLDGHILVCNESVTKLTGLPKEKIIGRHFTELGVLNIKETPNHLVHFSQLIDGNQLPYREVEIKRGEENIRLEVFISLLTLDGHLNAYQVIARDITDRVQAKEALAASEDKLRALVEQVPAVVYTESAENRKTLYISPQVERLTGYSPAEWVSEPNMWKKMIHPEDLPFVLEEDERTTKTHEPFHVEYRLLARDGRMLWIRDEAVLIKNQAGTPLFWQAVMYDITERKQAEEAMLTTNLLLERTLEQSPVPMVLVSMPDGIIRSANSACRHFLGVEDEPSPVGTKLTELKISWFDFDMQGMPAKSENLPLSRSLAGLKTDVQERHIVRKDGTSVYGLVYGSPIFDTAGRVIAGYLVMIDITERKKANEALRESEERFHTLYDNASIGLYRTTPDGRIIMLNSAGVRMLGFDSFDEIANRNLNETGFEQDYSRKEFREKLESDGVVIGLERKWIKKDGSYIFVRESARAFRDENKKILYYDGSFEDISERKQAEVQLRKLSRAVDQSPASIVITDLQGKIEYVNPKFSQVTGYGFTEVLGQTPRILKSGKTTQEEYKKMWDTILSGNVWQGELLNKTKTGETFWEFATIAPVFSEDGKIINFMALKENITVRKQAELELQHRKEDLELINMLNDVINCGESLEEVIDTLNNEAKRIYSAIACTVSLLSPDEKIATIQRNTISPIMVKKIEQLIGQPIPKIHVHIREGGYIHKVLQNEKGTITNDPKLIQQWIMEFAENTIVPPVLRVLAKKFTPQIYRILKIRSSIAIPLTHGNRVIGLLELAGKDMFTEDVLHRVRNISRQVTSAILRKQAEEGIHQRVTELEMLYQSGLAFGRLLTPKEVGQKILELLEEKLDWRNTRIRLYHPQNDSLELLDFNRPGVKGEFERRKMVEHYQTLISNSTQGMSGWVVQHGLTIRSGDVSNDPRYIEAYPGMRSGLYVPMKLGERVVGVISVEDEKMDAFSEADERLIVTLANQAASAFETARLFEETHQRVRELETLNSISLALRAASKQNEMLSIVLDEALAILNTSHGSIEIYNKATDSLDKTITRGWTAQIFEPSRKISEGIAGKVFTSGEPFISHEYASDPEAYAPSRNQIPPNWGGISLPIRTTQKTLGVLSVSVPSERELTEDEIRLLSILSEMTGAALQRMQLHEQTVRRLEQLKALRAVDQAISSSRDMRLTLNVLLTHTISQLGVDAADVLLLHSGSNLLELVAGQGFHTLLLENTSLSDSFAGQAILEHRSVLAIDYKTVNPNSKFAKIWKEEGFVYYWCVPLIVKGEVKGVLEVYCRDEFTPDAEWLEFLEALAGQAAIAIDSTQLFSNLQRANLDLSLAYDATIEGWSHAMDLRDHETEGHTLRVTDLTVKLAHAMRVSESQLTAIRRGALLHDIGKMGIPDSILLKEGNLTEEEWVVMRKHPELAREMLLPINYLNDALDIPYCHHEKWDGSGYPQKLKGDQIPLVARIFAIVDVWDALTNDRTYRKKWTKQKALEYIKEQSGSHFDPHIADVFLNYVEKNEFDP